MEMQQAYLMEEQERKRVKQMVERNHQKGIRREANGLGLKQN
jgi:hypothetical protein